MMNKIQFYQDRIPNKNLLYNPEYVSNKEKVEIETGLQICPCFLHFLLFPQTNLTEVQIVAVTLRITIPIIKYT